MKNHLLLAACFALCIGCTESDDGGPPSKGGISSVDQLPQDAPEQAKSDASSALSMQDVQQAQMQKEAEARARAMQEMQKQRGGG